LQGQTLASSDLHFELSFGFIRALWASLKFSWLSVARSKARVGPQRLPEKPHARKLSRPIGRFSAAEKLRSPLVLFENERPPEGCR